jgi:hypothetical protein
VDLRAMENQRKKEYDDEKINLDKAKLVQDRDLTEDKMEQDEELAEMRDETTLEKAYLSADVNLYNDKMKRRDVKTLKGQRS